MVPDTAGVRCAGFRGSTEFKAEFLFGLPGIVSVEFMAQVGIGELIVEAVGDKRVVLLLPGITIAGLQVHLLLEGMRVFHVKAGGIFVVLPILAGDVEQVIAVTAGAAAVIHAVVKACIDEVVLIQPAGVKERIYSIEAGGALHRLRIVVECGNAGSQVIHIEKLAGMVVF